MDRSRGMLGLESTFMIGTRLERVRADDTQIVRIRTTRTSQEMRRLQ
ncbi:hypothetical protein [Halostagnicola bangensis]